MIPSSDAEAHVTRRFPKKLAKRVHGSLRPRSLRGFVRGLPLIFQPGRSDGIDATYHFSFHGAEEHEFTIRIRDHKLAIEDALIGKPDLRVTADTETWLGFVAKERSLVWALLSRKIRLAGSPRLLVAFGRCFPS